MRTTRPVVSVIVSAGKLGEALERTLHSVEAQTFPSLEVLLCGRSERFSTLRDIGSARFVPLPVEVPDDGGEAWNAGSIRASGEFVCCLLAGDELAPTYLEKCLFQMALNGDDAGAAGEEPPDSAPHICVVRKTVLTAIIGSVLPGGLSEQRVRIASLLAGVMGVVPEILARPTDLALGSLATAWQPVPESIGIRTFSYAGLVTGWPQPRPTVLLAMPFLSMGGSETILSQLCRQLQQRGFRILVYTTLPAMDIQGDTTSWFENCCAGIYHLPRFLDTEHWPAFLAYLIQQHGVSVLWQVGSAYTYDLLPCLRELFPELAVVDLLFNTSGHTINHLKYNYLIDHVVTEHSGVKDWLVTRGVPEEHISVIPNGVDVELYSPQPKIDRRTLQPRMAGDSRFVAAFFGRFSEEKAPDVFLKIAALLADELSIEFVLCGAGPMEPSLRREAAASGLAGRVDFPGFVSVRDYLPGCDVVVVCSRLDGRPNIILESQAMGVPVIASRVGGIAEMLPPGEEDLLCEPAKADAFAAAIRMLARDSHRYRRSAEASRQHVEKNVRFAQSGSTYAQLFEDLRRKRQTLGRHLTPEAVAAGLGYERDPSSARQRTRRQARLPPLWRGLLRNALLLWKLRRSRQETRLLELFDADYYSRQFPGARKWRLSPLLHYLFLGFREGRNPSSTFGTRYYLTAYPDVRRGGLNPLLHFVMWGEQEGRLTALRPAIEGGARHPQHTPETINRPVPPPAGH